MGKILLFVLLFGTSVSSVFYAWIGVLAYYTLALWFPQSCWPWIFEGTRATFIIAIATILGFFARAMLGRVDFSVLKDKQNLFMGILWFCLIVSYFFNPYGLNETTYLAANSSALFRVLNKIFVFYFLSILLIDNMQKIKLLVSVLIVTTTYFIYWANTMYLSGMMRGPRLSGPGVGSIYTDENSFAMLFVMGIPFIYFVGEHLKNKFLKYLMWGLIPFGWHAVFLTGSRGGIVGLMFGTLFMALVSKEKLLRWVIPIALVVGFTWQAGPVMKRRAVTIFNHEVRSDGYEGESSTEGRLNAWKAGAKMMMDHPITGVGIGNFMPAFGDYSNKVVRVAHSTAIQLGSELGVFAGGMYLLLFLLVFWRYWKEKRTRWKEGIDPFLIAVNKAIVGSLLGFFVCSLFLNLVTYDVFYYLLVLSMVRTRLVNFGEEHASQSKESVGYQREYFIPSAQNSVSTR